MKIPNFISVAMVAATTARTVDCISINLIRGDVYAENSFRNL